MTRAFFVVLFELDDHFDQPIMIIQKILKEVVWWKNMMKTIRLAPFAAILISVRNRTHMTFMKFTKEKRCGLKVKTLAMNSGFTAANVVKNFH